MTWAKQLLTLLVLANWFACIVHCQSEQVRVDGRLTSHADAAFHVASQTHSGEDCGICDWVLTGGCRNPDCHVAAPQLVPALISEFAAALRDDATDPREQVHFAEWSTPPPDLPGTFLFVCHTALLVRAPSLAS